MLTIVFIMMRDISQLLNMYMVAASLFYGMSMLALLVMRWTKPDVPRPFKVDHLSITLHHAMLLPGLDHPASVHLAVLLLLHCGPTYRNTSYLCKY